MVRPAPVNVGRELARRASAPASVDRLLNIGPQSAAWLLAAGIRTREDLARLGVIEACRLIRKAGRPASVLLAYALEGALTDTHWNRLPHASKVWLRTEFERLRREPRT